VKFYLWFLSICWFCFKFLMCLYVCFVLSGSMSKPKHIELGSTSSIMQILNQRQNIRAFNSSPLGYFQSCNVDQPPNTLLSSRKFCDEVESPMKTQFLDNPIIATIMSNELHTTETLNNTL
jgi:hypothetical protein